MTTELTKAAQQALEQLEFLNACYPHKTAADAIAALQSALTQRPAAQAGEVDTGPRVLREVFAVCEDTMDKMAAESTEFSRGRAFEAKGISRAIGTWFQDEYCGRSHMGEPSLPAPQQATPASAPQSLLVRLAGIAAECSDPDTTDALDALIATTQQATPEPEGYQRIFDAIGAATKSPAKGIVEISVTDFTRHIGGNIYTRPAPGVPEGFALVPVEPTPEMKSAGIKVEVYSEVSDSIGVLTWGEVRAIYRAMLTAAQAKGGEHE